MLFVEVVYMLVERFGQINQPFAERVGHGLPIEHDNGPALEVFVFMLVKPEGKIARGHLLLVELALNGAFQVVDALDVFFIQ